MPVFHVVVCHCFLITTFIVFAIVSTAKSLVSVSTTDIIAAHR